MPTVDTPTPAQKPYKPHGAALELFYCKDAEVLIEGPTGTGKTRAILEKLHLVAEKYPRCRILICRKTKASMAQSILQTFEDHVLQVDHPFLLENKMRANRTEYRYPNKSEIVVGGVDQGERLFSTEFDIVAVFEATEITEDEWEKFHRACRNHVVPYQQMLADCNPKQPTHWLNQRANTDKMTRLLSRHEDNPTITSEDMARGELIGGVRYLRMRLGQWAATEGAVYEEYDAAIHLVKRFDPPASWRRVRVVDFGYTDPFVCQWWALDEDSRAYLYREIYHTRRLVEDHAKQIMALSAGESIDTTVCDHDAEGRATLHKYGIDTIAAKKERLPGFQSVKARLRKAGDGRPRLFFMDDSLVERDESLAELRKPVCTDQEVEGYAYQTTKDGRSKEDAVKIDDHGLDGVRYFCMYVDPVTSAKLDFFGGERVWQPPEGATDEEAQEAWTEAMILDGLD